MKKSLLYLALGGVTLGGFYSCETLENLCDIDQDNLATGEVFVSSLNQMIDVYKRIDEANKNPKVALSGDTIDGAYCTKTGDTLKIDFGSTEVLCADNKLRKGKISTILTGDYTAVNGTANATLVNYYVDNTMIQGDFTAINKGPVAAPLFTVSTLSFKEGDKSTVDYALSAQWQAGFSTSDASDDIFDVSGTVNGTDLQNTLTFNSTITTPLHYVNACVNYVESGVMNIGLVGDSSVSSFDVDFITSDGCNNLFTATVDCEGSPISFTYPFN